MRQGQNPKRSRGRGRKPQNPLSRNMESNGPDVKIRGTAVHIYEKYQTLARDAQSSGDRIGAESYFQYAEHYYRLIMAAQAQQDQNRPDNQPRISGNGRDDDQDVYDDDDGSDNEQTGSHTRGDGDQAQHDDVRPEPVARAETDASAEGGEEGEKPAPRRRAPRRRRPPVVKGEGGEKADGTSKPNIEDVPA